ncbi:transcriptional regulator GcvA [Sorangium sp. So ce281]|uniref:transcriptional regulator GcvA n=1 Tax=unclassified Sorangium TaxID=2621164 RepID=UPI003F5F7436
MTSPAPGDRPPPLPSLTALQAFEAAARHSSVTHAARELGVTQTAISHQIRALEDTLETALFRRSPRGISLTEDGERWAAELGVVFARLREANARLRRPAADARPAVSVSVTPSFGARWLVPRLGQFLVSHPEVDVRISATERLVDLAREPVDIGIRYGLGSYPGLLTVKLADDALIVAAAPSVASKRARWRVEDLSHEVLLGDDHPDAWGRWFRERSRRLPARVRQSQLTDSSMLVDAAVRGQGVALARWSLAAAELDLGRLVLLFPRLPALPTGLAYYLVSTRASLRRKPVAAFRDWVVSESASLRRPGG